MNDFSISSTPTTQTSVNPPNKTVEQVKTNAKDIKIFDFGGDKNKNNVVDVEDFDNPEILAKFKDKGLIGKPWEFVKQKLGELFNLKDSTGKVTEYGGYGRDGKSDKTHLMTYDEAGRITKRDEVVIYTEDDDFFFPDGDAPNKSKEKVRCETYDNYQYDSKGNPISFDCTTTITDERTRKSKADVINVYDNNETLVRTTTNYTEMRTGGKFFSRILEYNSNGDLISDSSGTSLGGYTVKYEYDGNGKLKNTETNNR